MPVHNAQIAAIFNELADLLDIEGANPFRVRAYRNAARVVGNWPSSLAEATAQGQQMPKLPGIGADLSQKIQEIARTGHLKGLREVRRRVPRELLQLLKVPGLGPKRAQLLSRELGIRNIRDLQRAAKSGRLTSLPGFGDKIARKILEEIGKKGTTAIEGPQRVKYAIAEQIAEPLLAFIRQAPGVRQAIVAGSYRRRQETVGDLDLLVTCRSPRQLMERFAHYEEVERVLSQGITRSTVIFRSGVQVDLRVVGQESYGSALHYFTGSKAHNIAIRTMALKKGLKINEYGVFRGSQPVAGRTEEEVYQRVGLPYIEPELRENRGEIEAALKGMLPSLVTLEDIRGDLHAHTDETDGRCDLETMARAAEELGYAYLAITDHTQRLTMARGLDPRRLRAQIRKIDRLNSKLRKLTLLKASEVDILEDGSLDLPDEVLEELDITVCSVHSRFGLDREKQTERILRAMDNPNFKILGHPSGRLIQARDPYEVDLERIMRAARDRGCALEINSQPDRMDLNDVYCRMAHDLGVKVAISSDAHSDNDLANMRYGIGQARRGWLGPHEVLNTRSLKALLKALDRK